MSLAIVSCIPFLVLCMIGWWIGRFYQLKFGDNPNSWLFLLGGALGLVGMILHAHGKFDVPSEILLFLGGLAVGGGALLLWYLLLGPRSE
jgi:hypothetical protein